MNRVAPIEAGIIAAGEGSRLRESHPGTVKPLVPVGGAPLCHWVVRSLSAAGARRVTVLHNSRGEAVRASLRSAFPSLGWTFLRADTASSWESFRLVARALEAQGEDFLISTVDALIPPAAVASFARDARASGADAALALTGFVDDEKPLWAGLGADGRVRALGDEAKGGGLATAGLYYLTRPVAAALPAPKAHASLRSYLGWLVASGASVAGVVLPKTLDVDRPQDLPEAEAFVKAGAMEDAPR